MTCDDSTNCDDYCGETKHFCPMWTEAQGETIDESNENIPD